MTLRSILFSLAVVIGLPAASFGQDPLAWRASRDTLYHIPTDLESYYEPSRSFHVFSHWRPRTTQPMTHVR